LKGGGKTLGRRGEEPLRERSGAQSKAEGDQKQREEAILEVYGLDKGSFHPPYFDYFDSVKVTHSQFVFLVGHKDMFWGCIDRTVLAEVGDALELEKACTDRVQGHRIFSNEEALVIGDESSVKGMGAAAVELGSNQTQDVDAGFSLDKRFIPDGGER
jgi:hypothetical protein